MAVTRPETTLLGKYAPDIFEKADLTEADLSASNFYGAEFLDVVLDRTKLDSANVKMTKLAGKVKK